ncbi:MAG: hypothetical protein LCH30_06625 [Proteobacteria bacterium]|nr:hypothetical protein [Pseudomonadota bacterium]
MFAFFNLIFSRKTLRLGDFLKGFTDLYLTLNNPNVYKNERIVDMLNSLYTAYQLKDGKYDNAAFFALITNTISASFFLHALLNDSSYEKLEAGLTIFNNIINIIVILEKEEETARTVIVAAEEEGRVANANAPS